MRFWIRFYGSFCIMGELGTENVAMIEDSVAKALKSGHEVIVELRCRNCFV